MSFINNQLEIRGKTAVIIDGGYLRVILKFHKIKEFDYQKFSNDLCTPSFRLRTYYFDSKILNEQSKHDELQLFDRFEVVIGKMSNKQVTCKHCDHKFNIPIQKGVDVALAGKLIHLATTKQVDKIILVAGDQDFIPAVKTVKETGVLIELVYDTISISTNLKKLVDERTVLKKEYLLKFGIENTSTKEIEITSDDEEELFVQENGLEQVTIDNEGIEVQENKKDSLIPETNLQILKNAFDDIFKEQMEEEMLIQVFGGYLIKKYPTWREDYKKKKLTDLISNLNEFYEIYKKNDDQLYIKTKNFETNSLLKSFLLNNMEDYFKDNSEILTTNDLGLILSQKNNNWRDTFRVKNKPLRQIIYIHLRDKYLVNGEGRITPK